MRARDVTRDNWSIADAAGDELVVYTPEVGKVGIGTQRRRSDVGFAVVLDAERLDRLIAELQDRRARMPRGAP